jgi:hypothetical protein
LQEGGWQLCETCRRGERQLCAYQSRRQRNSAAGSSSCLGQRRADRVLATPPGCADRWRPRRRRSWTSICPSSWSRPSATAACWRRTCWARRKVRLGPGGLPRGGGGGGLGWAGGTAIMLLLEEWAGRGWAGLGGAGQRGGRCACRRQAPVCPNIRPCGCAAADSGSGKAKPAAAAKARAGAEAEEEEEEEEEGSGQEGEEVSGCAARGFPM